MGIDLPRNDERSAYAAVPSGYATAPAQNHVHTTEDLHVCPACSSELVYPLDWAPVDMCHWRVELRCPECEWTEAGLYEQAALDRFDEVLDAATDALVDDLTRLQRSNFEDEVERFNLALQRDLVLPEDF